MIIAALLALNAAALPRCDKMGNRLCDFLQKNIAQPFIAGPDDTFVLNRQYVPPALPKRAAGFATLQTMAKLLATIDKPGLSAYAKIDLAGKAPEIFTKDEVEMHWPLDGSGEGTQIVKSSEIMKALADKAGVATRDAYVAAAKNKREEIETYNAELNAIDPNVMLADRVRKMPEEWQKRRRAKLDELIEFARKSNVDVVTRGNANRETWTDEQKNLVARLGAKVEVLDWETAAKDPDCEDPAGLAFHGGRDRLKVCPAALALPDANIVHSAGHELAHGLDPCAVQSAFGKLDPAAVARFLQGDGLNKVNKDRLAGLLAKGYVNLNAEVAAHISDPRFTARLVNAGAVKVEAPALKEMPSVYRDVYACLARQYGLRAPTAEERQARVRDVYDGQFNFRGGAHEDKTQVLEYYRYLSTTFSECPFLLGPKTHMNEVIADGFGIVAKDKFMRLHPPASETEKMVAMISTQVCRYREQVPAQLKDVNASGMRALMEDAPESAEFRRLLGNEHPSDIVRAGLEVDLPGLAKIYGCERGEARCLDALGPSGETARASEAGAHR